MGNRVTLRRSRRRVRSHLFVHIAIAALLLSGLSATVLFAGPWQGQEALEDGVTHLMNPAEPSGTPLVIGLEELWRIGGDTDAEGEFFGVIGEIDSDDAGNVYLLDIQLSEVKLFSSDGSYIRTIGREGEGPGEFRRPIDLFLTSDGKAAVLQIMPGKIVLLEPDGTPSGEWPLTEDPVAGNLTVWAGEDAGDHIVVELTTMTLEGTGGTRTVRLAAISPEGKELTRYFESSSKLNFAMLEIDERVGFRPAWETGADGRLYVVPTYGEYEIHVFQPDGKLERVITRDYEPLMRTDQEKAEMRSRFIIRGPTTEPKITVSEHHPDIARLFPRDDGTLWVLSSRGRTDLPDGAMTLFDVYDDEGHFVREVTLEGEGDAMEDAFVFLHDRLYVVTSYRQAVKSMNAGEATAEDSEVDDEEPMPMEVICYRLDGDLAKLGTN